MATDPILACASSSRRCRRSSSVAVVVVGTAAVVAAMDIRRHLRPEVVVVVDAVAALAAYKHAGRPGIAKFVVFATSELHM